MLPCHILHLTRVKGAEMNWFAKLWWMFGIVGAIVALINPLLGLFGVIVSGITMFIMKMWEINMHQRLQYYQNPEKLYQVGRNIKGSEQIHDLQVKNLSHSVLAICIGGKVLAVFSILLQVTIDIGVAMAGLMNVKRGYYYSMSPLHIISKEQYQAVGIPLSIVTAVFNVCMEIAFWRHCEYYKKKIKGEVK